VAQAGGNIRFAWRGHLTLASVGAPPPLIFLEAKRSLSFCAHASSGAIAPRGRAHASAPAIAGEGDHWSSRSERTVVEGALAVLLRCCCRGMTAVTLFVHLFAQENSFGRASFHCPVVFIQVSLPPAPLPPPFGWSPFPAVAGQDAECGG
jgi:hypothetical protein